MGSLVCYRSSKVFYESDYIINNKGIIFIFILLLSLSIKLIVLWKTPVINKDAIFYISLAKRIVQTGKMPNYPCPLLPIVITLFHFVIHDWVWASHVVINLALVLLVIPVYLIGKRLWGINGGLATSLFVAVSPYFNKYAIDVVKGPLFWLFGLFFIYFLLLYLESRKLRFLIYVILFFFLAILSRREAVLLPLVATLMLLKVWLKRKRRILKLTLMLSVPALVFVIVLGIFSFHFNQTKGDLREFPKRISVVVRNNVKYFSIVKNYHMLNKKLKKVEATLPKQGGTSYNFFEIARHYIPVVYAIGYVELLARTVYPIFFFLSILGIREGSRIDLTKKYYTVLFFLIAYLLLGFFYLNARNWVDKRYILFSALLFHFWIWPGFLRITAYMKKLNYRTSSVAIIVFILLISLPLLKTVTANHGREVILKEAGCWIKKHGKLQGPILCNDPRIAFYADRKARINKVRKDLGSMAKDLGCPYIALIYRKNVPTIPQTGCHLVAKFIGRKKVIYVYMVDTS